MGKVLDFPRSTVLRQPRKHRVPLRRQYTLGTITTATDKTSQTIDYWLQRGPYSKFWRLMWSYDRNPRIFISMVTLWPEEVMSHVENVGFKISMADWLAMGWRPSVGRHSAKLVFLNPATTPRKARRRRKLSADLPPSAANECTGRSA